MNEPGDAARRAWQAETPPNEAGAWRARIERRRTEQRRRLTRFWTSAAIIVPSWAAAFWLYPDLRPLATIGLLVGAWLMAQVYRSVPRGRRDQASEMACASFEMQRLSRERDFHRSFPRRLLPAIVAGQVAIVATLLTNPRFERNRLLAVGLAVFIVTVITALTIIYRRSRTIASELDREIMILKRVES